MCRFSCDSRVIESYASEPRVPVVHMSVAKPLKRVLVRCTIPYTHAVFSRRGKIEKKRKK
jgi:hypothetical protein